MPESENSTSARSEFPFRPGDDVLVRVRENGTSGKIVAKFEAECREITPGIGPSSPWASFELPWGMMGSVQLRPNQAEFEVIDDG